jgi:hypothetical protein
VETGHGRFDTLSTALHAHRKSSDACSDGLTVVPSNKDWIRPFVVPESRRRNSLSVELFVGDIFRIEEVHIIRVALPKAWDSAPNGMQKVDVLTFRYRDHLRASYA